MSETPDKQSSRQDDQKRSFFSPSLEELYAALDRLYVKNNLSGRLNFRVRWPYAATIVFGSVLLEHDAEGTPDKKQRAKLEDKADIRRLELLADLDKIKKESISDGEFVKPYAVGVLERYGHDFLQYVYSETVIEALLPGEKPEAVKPQGFSLKGVKPVELPREGITYKELLDSLEEEKNAIPLTLTFNERAYMRPSVPPTT